MKKYKINIMTQKKLVKLVVEMKEDYTKKGLVDKGVDFITYMSEELGISYNAAREVRLSVGNYSIWG